MILNPVCSTLIGKIGGEPKLANDDEEEDDCDISISTDGYPNGAVGQFIDLIKDKGVNNVDDFQWENSGGGGHFEFVESAFDIALKVVEGKFDLETAEKLEEIAWNTGMNIDDFALALSSLDKEQIINAIEEIDLKNINLPDLFELLKIPKEKWDEIKRIIMAAKI